MKSMLLHRRGSVQKSDTTKERRNERTTNGEQLQKSDKVLSAGKSDLSKERRKYNERATY